MQYAPSYTKSLERERVLVYVGSSMCAFANHPDLPDVIDSAKVAIAQRAKLLGASFSAVGIALDRDAKKGVAHLDKFGPFDEISAGRTAYGLAANSYQSILEITPQVSVLECRRVDELGAPSLDFGETELIRYYGPSYIACRVRRGAPIPLEQSYADSSPQRRAVP